MRNYQYVLALLLLSLLAGFGWWLGPGREEAPPGAASPHSPQYVIDGLEVVENDAEGRPAHRLRAPQLRHFDDDGRTELDAPRLTLYDPETPPWEVEAEAGWVSKGGDRVHLQGQVVIQRDAGPANRPVRIETSDLWVEPGREYAETDRHVAIYSNQDWIHSDGAQVWFSEAMRVKFLANVRGRYEIN